MCGKFCFIFAKWVTYSIMSACISLEHLSRYYHRWSTSHTPTSNCPLNSVLNLKVCRLYCLVCKKIVYNRNYLCNMCFEFLFAADFCKEKYKYKEQLMRCNVSEFIGFNRKSSRTSRFPVKEVKFAPNKLLEIWENICHHCRAQFWACLSPHNVFCGLEESQAITNLYCLPFLLIVCLCMCVRTSSWALAQYRSRLLLEMQFTWGQKSSNAITTHTHRQINAHTHTALWPPTVSVYYLYFSQIPFFFLCFVSLSFWCLLFTKMLDAKWNVKSSLCL